jgi:uncharacterized protein YdaU (DUF1376 family)
MTRLPVMPLWVKDLLVDTENLSAEEFGAYMRLLCHMWIRDGSVPNDDRSLWRACGVDSRRWSRVKLRLTPYLLFRADGNITQHRLEKVRTDRITNPVSDARTNGANSNETKQLDMLSRAGVRPHSSTSKKNKNNSSTLDGSAAIGPSPGFEGRSGPPPQTTLSKTLVQQGLKGRH